MFKWLEIAIIDSYNSYIIVWIICYNIGRVSYIRPGLLIKNININCFGSFYNMIICSHKTILRNKETRPINCRGPHFI